MRIHIGPQVGCDVIICRSFHVWGLFFFFFPSSFAIYLLRKLKSFLCCSIFLILDFPTANPWLGSSVPKLAETGANSRYSHSDDLVRDVERTQNT